ncbi:hypothetical protein [Candidatus Palauibacter sp.]|uniref:hypothetical protein n=1 Tax=Candidatus Palauibacter sp. TaxID=3101350 RepID=UPI003AF29AB2
MKTHITLLTGVFVGVGVFIGGCDTSGPTDATSGPTDDLTFTFDFDSGSHGFVAGFADYPPAREEDFDLTSGHGALPAPLALRSGLFISGLNASADLFMFFKGPIDGLQPGRYEATVSLEIATDVSAGCVGVGSPPGEGVTVKGGATEVEPLPALEGSWLRMNIDVGIQANSGKQAVVLGDVANSRRCEESPRWEMKSYEGRSISAPVSVSSDGRAWLLFGTDSGFEGRTGVYFTRVTVSFEPT